MPTSPIIPYHAAAQTVGRLACWPPQNEPRLSPDLQNYLRQHSTLIDGKQRRWLYLRNDPESFIALVLRGHVFHLLQEPDGHEVILDQSQVGEWVGESALLHPGRRHTSAQLSPDCQLLLLHQQHFDELRSKPELIKQLQQQLVSRLQRISNFVESVCLCRLETRLARHLLQEIEQHGQHRHGEIQIPLTVNQSTLAAMLNVSRPRLNAQLRQFQRDGIIHHTRRILSVLDAEQLKRLAQAG